MFEFLYDVWWRVEAEGVRNVPAHGRALLVANHAGSIFPFDATMMTVALMKEHPLPRWPRFMVLDWAFSLPFLSSFMRRGGGIPASPHNAVRLLESDELVMVFPEGVKGTSKPFADRYRLQRFGRGGFVEMALETGAPIVPVAVVGSEEIYPKLGESRTLARVVGAPFVPITPTFPWLGPLGLVPLPSRWRIEFCEPIEVAAHGPDAAADRRLVFDISEQVRETIQETRLRESGQDDVRLSSRLGIVSPRWRPRQRRRRDSPPRPSRHFRSALERALAEADADERLGPTARGHRPADALRVHRRRPRPQHRRRRDMAATSHGRSATATWPREARSYAMETRWPTGSCREATKPRDRDRPRSGPLSRRVAGRVCNTYRRRGCCRRLTAGWSSATSRTCSPLGARDRGRSRSRAAVEALGDRGAEGSGARRR